MDSPYTDAQIDHYLDHVSIPSKYRRRQNPSLDLKFLSTLHSHQLSSIPYENLSLHYSRDRTVSLDPQYLYNKFTHNGRGGYCMELSLFYNHILRGLGFRAYTAGVRIRLRTAGVPDGDYISFVHIVNIVTLPDGSKYHVDVGFGGDGATKPLPLVDAVVTRNIGTQDLRLAHESIPQFSGRPDEKFWIYQYRNGPDLPWNSFYCFTEHEHLQKDFEMGSFWVSQHPESFQRQSILVIKFLRREQGGIYGKRMLVDTLVKENLGGKTAVIETLATEEERIAALKRHFGITLTEEQREGIRGFRTEILEQN
ncbi:N-terminal acetyltransferase [Agyrium rufum]|nr:N-terminal acetyltransferase [Agyrium rufum]